MAFYPAENLLTGPDNGDKAFPKFNYLYDVTTNTTGLVPLVPLSNLPATLPSPTYHSNGDLKGFSTTALLDTVGPAVMKTSPSWNYVDVDPSSQPTVTWNQPLDPATVNSSNVTLVEKDTGTPVACSVSFDHGTESYYDSATVRQWRPFNKLKLVPNAALKNDTSYTITLGTGLTNLKGLSLLNTYAGSFHTRPAPAPFVAGAGPYVVSSNVAAYNKNVTYNGLPITLTFNQAMDASTLTTDTVHLTLHGSSQDEYLDLNYDAASKTLTLTSPGLEPGKRYELKLDGENIKGASGTGGGGQSLQGAGTPRPFNTAPYGEDDPSHPEGNADPDGGGDPDQPANITLTLTTGDDDAGSYGSMTATLPDGSTQAFPIPGATDSYKTTESPEYPDGTTFEITPYFTKGSDTEVTHEKSEAGVRVSLGTTNLDNGAGNNYVVFKQSNGVTTCEGPLNVDGYKAVPVPDSGWQSSQSTAPTPAAAGSGGPEKLQVKPLHIVPIDADKGRLGDIVPSNNTGKEGAEDHFVTPKMNDQLSDPFVKFKVDLIDEEFADLKWGDVGEEVAGQPKQRKVKRDATGHPALTLVSKTKNKEVAKLNVWVVWADVTSTPGAKEFRTTTSPAGILAGVKNDNAAGSHWKFVFTIQPPEIITASEHPALEGELPGDTSPKVPGAGNDHPVISGAKADAAERYWDLSRQVKWKVTVPNGAAALIPPIDQAFRINKATFPGGDAEGNDDPGEKFTGSQNNIPYARRSGNGLDTDQIGQLSSVDGPSISINNNWGSPGMTFSWEVDFREFARLLIWDGKRTSSSSDWHRISDFTGDSLWHVNVEATWDGVKWVDGISGTMTSTGKGNTN